MRDCSAPWQEVLKDGFTNIKDLLAYLKLPESLGSLHAHHLFSTRVTKRFASLMEKGNPNDPLLLQVLPHYEELISRTGFNADPLEERQKNPINGLLHKYHGRVLLIFGACAINCRYCFRRHFPYAENSPLKYINEIYSYIKNNETIKEVILSGGDPLLMKDNVLLQIIEKLNDINHLTTLRIHTRIPIVLPERIDNSFLEVLKISKLKKIIVLHCNHANEIDAAVTKSCMNLLEHNVLLLNQSVILKDINDDARVLAELMYKLFEIGVLPYYLHQLDKVAGAGHFDVDYTKIKKIYSELQAQLPGYLVPKLVAEYPGKPNKTLLMLN